MSDVFLCNVADKYRGDYNIAFKNKKWGVPVKYEQRRNRVNKGDILILENMTYGAIVGKITNKIDEFDLNIWPLRNNDNYPLRVEFEILYQYNKSNINTILIKCLNDKMGFKYPRLNVLGLALKGLGGQFRELKSHEYCCIFQEMRKYSGNDPLPILSSNGLGNTCNQMD
jgi:hypothetical protein